MLADLRSCVQFDFPPTKLQFSALRDWTREPVFAAKTAISCDRRGQQPCRGCQNAASRKGFESRGTDPELCRKVPPESGFREYASTACRTCGRSVELAVEFRQVELLKRLNPALQFVVLLSQLLDESDQLLELLPAFRSFAPKTSGQRGHGVLSVHYPCPLDKLV